MDSTHLHLLLNHFPIVGTIVGAAVMAYGLFARSEATQRAAMLTWAAMALLAIPVLLTGEPAEERVEHLPGVAEALIEQHEDAAQLAFWAMEVLGVLSVLAFFLKPGARSAAGKAALLLGIAVSLLMARTGWLGGQIRHTEIRSGAAIVQPAEAGGQQDND